MQESETVFMFETYDPSFVNKTAILTQVSNLYTLEEETGIETLFKTLVTQLAVIDIKSRCDELIIVPQKLKVMQIELDSEQVVTQMFRPI